MSNNQQRLKKLLQLVVNPPDKAVCGYDVQQFALIADYELRGVQLPNDLHVVKQHILQCHDCRQEYNLLVDSVREIQISASESKRTQV